MLRIICSAKDLRFSVLSEIYENEEKTKVLDELLSLYSYLQDCFLKIDGAFLAIWEENNCCVSALRMEPYKDGFLLSGLQTSLAARRKGFANKLVFAALEYLKAHEVRLIYSHIQKRNLPSVRLHKKCGFQILSDRATLLDGSVTDRYYTLCKKI